MSDKEIEKIVNFDEFRKHNKKNDNWIIIDNKVVDVTNY